MLTLDEIKDRLKDRRVSVVSEKTMLSMPTIRAVREGRGTPHPTTLKLLSDYLLKDGTENGAA